MNGKMKEEEANEALKRWQSHGDMPPNEALGRILIAQNEVPFYLFYTPFLMKIINSKSFQVTILTSQVAEKDAKLHEVMEEYTSTKQMFSEYFKSTFGETKKQYEIIANILGVSVSSIK